MNKIWYDKAWEDLMYWHEKDRRMFEKIKALLKGTSKNRFEKRKLAECAGCKGRIMRSAQNAADEARLYALRGGLTQQTVCYVDFLSNKVFRGDLKCIDRGDVRVGKAERLKNADGFCSMRIDGEHRLVYRIKDNQIEIAQCKDHYKDK